MSQFREAVDDYMVYGYGFIATAVYQSHLDVWHVEIRDAQNGTFQCFALFRDDLTVKMHTEAY